MRHLLQNTSLFRLILAFVLTCHCSVFANSDETIPRIPKANICEQVLSHGVSLILLATTEYMAVTAATIQATWNRCKARHLKGEACRVAESDFSTLKEFLEFNNQLKLAEEDWVTSSMGFPRYRSLLVGGDYEEGDLSILQHHLETIVPVPYSAIAQNTMNAYLNYPQVMAWIKTVREEALTYMWNDGLRKRDHLSNHYLREYYLDQALARHMQKKGFKIKGNGLPHNMVTYNSYIFNFVLAAGYAFIDWTGASLQSARAASHKDHYARGHLLAMAYGADHVENFVQLMQYIGRTQDKDGMWGQMWDNVKSTTTPFWGGFWVYNFRKYLGIRY